MKGKFLCKHVRVMCWPTCILHSGKRIQMHELVNEIPKRGNSKTVILIMTVPIDGIILLQYTLMESRCAMSIFFFFWLIAYYTQLCRHQEVWLKVKVTLTKGLICKYQKLQCNTQMEFGKKKNHLHLISGMILNRNQSLLMRI